MTIKPPILLLALLLHQGSSACTAFAVTHDGRTLVGCNEDAWSINAQVRFEQGRDGGYGAIYFGHSNGSPFRAVADQMGMNEAGLVFDGLVLAPQVSGKAHGGRQVGFDELMPMVLRSCADVQEAAALLRTIDLGWLNTAMIFLADRNGETLIVEADTMLLGNDPYIAVSNWRMSTCTDPDAIPIPRLQAGRALLSNDIDVSVEEGTRVLQGMMACRGKLGEGTLFSALFEPSLGAAHLYFYHDLSESVAFHLKTELAKGDRTLLMASVFGVRPEYEALLAYRTPFHQRWLWWSVALIGVFSVLGLLLGAGLFVMWVIACIRARAFITGLPWLIVGVGSALAIFLCTALLMNEGVFYFGLGDVVNRIHPLLEWTPLALLVVVVYLFVRSFLRPRHRLWSRGLALIHGALVAALAYWGLLFP